MIKRTVQINSNANLVQTNLNILRETYTTQVSAKLELRMFAVGPNGAGIWNPYGTCLALFSDEN